MSPSTALAFRLWSMPRWGDQVLTLDRQGNMIPWVHPTEIHLHNPSLKVTPLLRPQCWVNPSKASLSALVLLASLVHKPENSPFVWVKPETLNNSLS